MRSTRKVLVMSDVCSRKDSRIILALDVDNVQRAFDLMQAVRDHVGMVKIGKELIQAQLAGRVAMDALESGFEVFWDGKLNDIPTTMRKAASATLQFQPSMLNVHASSDVEGIEAVVQGVTVEKMRKTRVLVVTVLTSLNEARTEKVFGGARDLKVVLFARMALAAKADGIICSPKELAFLDEFSEFSDLMKVVPGTRSPGGATHDQKNVDSQEAAILNGADWLVIGREITESPDPGKAAAALNVRMVQAFEQRKALLAGQQ